MEQKGKYIPNQNQSQAKPTDEYITVKKTSPLDTGKSSTITEKLKSLKSMLSFTSNKSSDVNTADNSTKQDTQQQPPTCLKKLENKIVESVEVEQSLKTFIMIMAIGSGMICLSLLFIPLIITKPSAFTLTFGFGSLLLLISFLFYHGTKVYFQKIFAKDRFWISILFLISIICGIGFSIRNHYIISLICSIIQVVSLVVFLISFIPGGKCGIDSIKKTIKSPFTKVWVKMAENQIENS